MGEDLKKIKDKIKASDLDEPIKNLLLDIVYFEFQHAEEKMPRFSEEYGRLIKKYAEKFEVKE